MEIPVKMPIKIEIEDAQAAILTSYYKEQLGILSNKMQALAFERQGVENILAQLSKGKKPEVAKEQPMILSHVMKGDYSEDWAIHKKISYVFSKEGNKPLTARFITDYLLKIDDKLKQDEMKAAKSISTILSLQTDKIFKKVKVAGKDNEYTLIGNK